MVQKLIKLEPLKTLLPPRPVLIEKQLRRKRSLGVSVNVIRRRVLLQKVLGAVIQVAQYPPEEAATAALILVGKIGVLLHESIVLKLNPRLKLKLGLNGQRSFRICVKSGFNIRSKLYCTENVQAPTLILGHKRILHRG